LVESSLPYHIKIDQKEDSFDIKSIGHETFGGQLTHNVSAHPKVNHKTGELYTFGYSLEGAWLSYTLFNKDKKAINGCNVDITSARMIHDFPITDNYCIFPDMPLEFDPKRAMKEGGFVFKFDATQPSRYGIMKKLAQQKSAVQWFEMPTHFAFHYVNAWEEKNAEGEDIIVLYGCAQE